MRSIILFKKDRKPSQVFEKEKQAYVIFTKFLEFTHLSVC